MTTGSFLDLGVRGRTLFGGAYLVVQIALIFTGPLRPDTVFAFQMFNESSTLVITLSRRVNTPDGGTTVVPTDGTWQAHNSSGKLHTVRWHDRVQDPMIGVLGRQVRAAYGVRAQLDHLQAALDDFSEHLDGDVETRSLVADVTFRKNGRPPETTRLESIERGR